MILYRLGRCHHLLLRAIYTLLAQAMRASALALMAPYLRRTAEATGLKWAAAAGGGKVLQVVYAVTTTSTNIATTSLTTTTLTASITPSSASSKVLIIANNNIYNDTSGRGAAAAITRGATTLIHQNDTNNGGTFNLSDSRGTATIPIQYLDSPSTTSSTTYTIKATSIGGTNVTFQNGGSPSNILLFEIGA